ncbi:hypothetical protein [Novosphingobium sp. MMS21-SN21R]|uniref:hypothetical protein n=1 Tax=Novosphingobium sp. MMS21-SN21R TaxID=2969298 RepID=UPI002888E3E9|nr:hypothetical protein [Novosphingobium sp. MMS21-SN21R]MDT0509981.1 hypothetical protein [Novosphingobium sp. MMS21-SN21R]
MANLGGSARSGAQLREIAARLREAYVVPVSDDLTISDLMAALDSPELRAILAEMQCLRDEELAQLERLLSRHAANDR